MLHLLDHLTLKSLAFRVYKSQSRKVTSEQSIRALPIDANPNRLPTKTTPVRPNGRQSFEWPIKIPAHLAKQFHLCTPTRVKRNGGTQRKKIKILQNHSRERNCIIDCVKWSNILHLLLFSSHLCNH